MLVILLLLHEAQAQNNTGIGTSTPNPNALLDLHNAGQPLGLLLPRVNIGDFALGASDYGLCVYDTIQQSIFFWTGSGWTELAPGWLLNGNSGTNPAINYLGTNDAQDLAFRTNSIEYMRLTSTGKLGIGISNPSANLEVTSSETAIAGITSGNNGGDYAISGINTGTGDVAGFFHSINPLGGLNSHGVYGQADGQGSGVFGGHGGTAGNAAVFMNFNPGNSNSVVNIFNAGTGSALNAQGEIISDSLTTGRIYNTGNILMDSAGGGIIRAYDPHHAIYIRNGYSGAVDRLELREFGEISFHTGGLINNQIERMTIDFNGNVGIGNTTPTEKLTVTDNVFDGIMSLNSSAGNTLMDFNNTGSNSSVWTFGYLGNTGVNPGFMTFLNGSHRFSITNNGDVGINETNPAARLEINSSGNSSASYGLLINNSSLINVLSVRDDGRLGIGTSNPQNELEIATPNSSIRLGSWSITPNYNLIDLKGSNGNDYNLLSSSLDPNLYINRPTGQDIRFRMNNADQMILNSAGDVGIGTASPVAKLDVNGTVRVTGESEINGTHFINTASTSPPTDNEIPVGSGAIANVIFYTPCACPTVAAVLHIDYLGTIKVLSQAGGAGNNISGSGTNILTINDCCGLVVPYVFTMSGGIATITYPSGFFTEAKWVVTAL